ncbi:MAG TPA: ankyrin repeat domain-containing protein [Phenylobacterium sp.]|nr:ankyrin repeat domain-containing protein [Phenylobacterium sp.]
MRAKAFGIVWFLLGMLSATLAVAADRDLRLIEASRNDDVAAVKTLLAAGVDVNAPSGDGATALHWAAQNDDLALADLLLAKGAKVNAVTDLDITPLWIAASNSSTTMIKRLLDARADPNIAPPTNGTPLMLAAQQGNVTAVKTLLAHGAHPDAREAARGQTALMWAVSARQPDVVRALLEGRADVKARSTSDIQRMVLCCQLYEGDHAGISMVATGGYTPLLFAAQDGDVESTKLLLAAGADPNDAAPDGSSAVVIAAHVGQDDVAKLLLDAGANPNAAGSGYTALHVAATGRRDAIVQALVDSGAAINVRNKKGETPLTAALTPPGPPEGTLLAEEYNFLVNHKETAELLRKLGAKG